MKLRDEKISGKIKTMMLCSVSHELRTPLNQIDGMLYLAKVQCSDPKIEYYLSMAQNSSEFLVTKIDDILDYYEIETNNFKPVMASHNLSEFMTNIKESFMPIIDPKTKKLSIMIDKKAPDNVTFDKKRIRQVLNNLITNAVKYTEKGFVLVTIDWETVSTGNSVSKDNKEINNSNHYLKFQVSDSGCGISKRRNKELYSLFSQQQMESGEYDENGDQSATKLAGLGLCVAQKILKQFRAKLQHSSSVNVGSKFWFRLKVDEFEFVQPEDNQLY